MKITDPVCGGEAQLDDSLPRMEHGSWVYFFCSRECLNRFLEDPDRYAVAPPQAVDG